MKSLIELRQYLVSFAARCRAARWLGALFHVGVLRDIMADAEKEAASAAATAHAARVADDEAIQMLELAMRDGIDCTDTPAIERAIRLVKASRDRDHNLAEAFTLPAMERAGEGAR